MGNLDGGAILNKEYPGLGDVVPSSANCSLIRGLGALIYKSIDIDGTGGEVITSLFTFTGPIELVELWLVLTDVSDITTLSGVYFDAYDEANSVPLTADGQDLSGSTLNSIAVKDQDDAQVLRLLDADQVRYQESASFPREFLGGLINIKNGATNTIRLRADTDADTDVSLTVYMAYNCRHISTVVSVA